MKPTIVSLLLVYSFLANEKYLTYGRSEDDDYSSYGVEDLHRVEDWQCWYKDYYLKVAHCSSRILKSRKEISCDQFRQCRPSCRYFFGQKQCKMKCKFQPKKIAKFTKVVYRIKDKDDGLCKDSVVCVYISKCQGRWSRYKQKQCYFADDFYPWWIDHEKEYIKPKFTRKLFPSATQRQIFDCIRNKNSFIPVDPSLETTVKIITNCEDTFHKIGDMQIKTKFTNGSLFYLIGDTWTPIKYQYKHSYMKLGDTWWRFVVWRKNFYVRLYNLWAPLKISFGKMFFKFGKSWALTKVMRNKVYHNFALQWFELKLFNSQDLYSKMNKNWFKIKFDRHTNMIKVGEQFHRIFAQDKIMYIMLGRRWFPVDLKARRCFIRLDSKWYEIEFEEESTLITIDQTKYPAEFRLYSIFIQVNGGWFQVEPYYEYLFFKIDKFWIHLQLQNNHFYIYKNKSQIQLTMDKQKKLFYKSSSTNRLESILEMNIDRKDIFDTDNFYKSENPMILKMFGGHWLPYKDNGGNATYMVSEKWMKMKTENGKLYYEDFHHWFQICLVGNAEFLKIHGTWWRMKREAENLFFFDTGKWHQIKFRNSRVYLRINNAWKSLAFDKRKKFVRLGNKYLQLRFDEIHDNLFYLYLGRNWFQIMMRFGKYYIKINKNWERIEFPVHKSVEILFQQQIWISATFRDKKVYLQNDRCWLEVCLENRVALVKIGDTFRELRISTNKIFSVNISGIFYKLTEKNEIFLNTTKVKITYIDGQLQMDFDNNWLPLRIIKEKLFVKIVDSWARAFVNKNGMEISVKVDNNDIILLFENGILCEQYRQMKVPINIRFGNLYYNLNDRWVRVYPQSKMRYLKLNKKLVEIQERYLKRKIGIYKKKLLKRCWRFSEKNKKEDSFKLGRVYQKKMVTKKIRKTIFRKMLPPRSKYQKHFFQVKRISKNDRYGNGIRRMEKGNLRKR